MQKDVNIFLSLPNDISGSIVRDYIKDYDELVEDCNLDELLSKICHLGKKAKSVIVIDTDDDAKNVFLLIKKIKQVQKNIKIIVLSSDTSANFSIDALRAGVDEILSKPVLKDKFIDVIETSVKTLNDPQNSASGCKIISVFSNKGGIGKTAIAVNLGVEIAKLTKQKVAIVDLNLQLGDVTTFLDLNPTFDISYVMQHLKSLNEEFLLSSMQQYKDTSLYVLAEPPFAEQANDISKEQIVALLKKMKETFSYIIVDTGANFDDKTIGALDNSDIILLSAIVNLPAIRNCQRCLDLFDRFGYNREKVKIILNRYMENDEIKTSDVERVLDKKVWWKIPNNYITMISAINKGLPVCEINQDANIAQNFKEFAAKLTDGIEYLNIAKNKKV